MTIIMKKKNKIIIIIIKTARLIINVHVLALTALSVTCIVTTYLSI